MNRQPISATHLAERNILVDSDQHKQQVQAWTTKLLSKDKCVPDGHLFVWSRAGSEGTSTAYLFDAVMCNVEYAQIQLMKASSSAGKQAYKSALDAAKTYQFILQELLPKWTFNHYTGIPDCTHRDIYGHYCLARAMAYSAVGKADLQCTDAAQIAASANAAHMHMMAAQLIDGDCNVFISRAQENVGDALVVHGKQHLDAWDKSIDDMGACKALASYQEAHRRYLAAGLEGCADKVTFAYERNQVNWHEPGELQLSSIIRPRITPLPG